MLQAQFQHTAARRRLFSLESPVTYLSVSTHSRPKAAAEIQAIDSFAFSVSTHSRPKAADITPLPLGKEFYVSTHSRPKAAVTLLGLLRPFAPVSTHSRPKAAANWRRISIRIRRFQHTAARRRLERLGVIAEDALQFQHTAARRRLASRRHRRRCPAVSTHSRPKAAGTRNGCRLVNGCFNTQPPEGGWRHFFYSVAGLLVSTHSRPKAAVCGKLKAAKEAVVSTHSRPKAAGELKTPISTTRLFQHTAARRRLITLFTNELKSWLFQHTAARRRLSLS